MQKRIRGQISKSRAYAGVNLGETQRQQMHALRQRMQVLAKFARMARSTNPEDATVILALDACRSNTFSSASTITHAAGTRATNNCLNSAACLCRSARHRDSPCSIFAVPKAMDTHVSPVDVPVAVALPGAIASAPARCDQPAIMGIMRVQVYGKRVML
jgi:hypothetical protein